MRNFEYFTPTRVIFGKDTHLKIGTVLKEQNCNKVLIHYGSHSAVSSGLIDEIRSSLDEAGISYVTLGGVVPNPRLSKVREGIELCRKEQLIFFWLLAVAALLIPARPSAMDLPIRIQMYGIFFSAPKPQKPVFL